MRFLDSDEYRRRQRIDVLHNGPRFTREQGREIFREMVRMETRNGPLSPRRRHRLIQYAAALELTALEAGTIVTEVYREAPWNETGTEPSEPLVYRMVESAAAPRTWPVWLRMTLALIAVLAFDRLIRLIW